MEVKLWMFVPCDNEGQALIKPPKEILYQYRMSLIPIWDDYGNECYLWERGKERLLFNGYKINETQDTLHNPKGEIIAWIGPKIEWEYSLEEIIKAHFNEIVRYDTES